MPAEKDEQLSWLMSLGTETYRVIEGSLSIIMSDKALTGKCSYLHNQLR